MIIGVLGLRGTGKSAVVQMLVDEGFVGMAFADPLKRICMNLWDFSEEQMWGDLEIKETPDLRYKRDKHEFSTYERGMQIGKMFCACCGISVVHLKDAVVPHCYLTPRYALQTMGTEGGRQCYPNTWVMKALQAADYVESMGYGYLRTVGAFERVNGPDARHVAFSDTRFINEVSGIKAIGGRVFRVRRPLYEKPQFNHRSETEQLSIPDSDLDGVIWNDGTLDDLRTKVREMIIK